MSAGVIGRAGATHVRVAGMDRFPVTGTNPPPMLLIQLEPDFDVLVDSMLVTRVMFPGFSNETSGARPGSSRPKGFGKRPPLTPSIAMSSSMQI